MPFVPRVALVGLVLGFVGWVEAQPPVSAGPFEPVIRPRVAATSSPAAVDTLHASAEADTPLILSLPASLQEQVVERYRLLRGPALSGVAGRSFTWIPQGADPGIHEALLQARHRNAPPDTLVLRIDLRS